SGLDLSKRLLSYYNQSELTRNSRPIKDAILKYGHDNFILAIIEYCSKDTLLDQEQYYLDLLRPDYNILKFAYSMLGFKHSPENIAKFKAKMISPEHKAKLSVIHTGKIVDEKTRAKLSTATTYYKSNNPLTPEALANIKAKTTEREGVAVTVLNLETQEVLKFATRTEAGKFLGVTRQAIYNAHQRGFSEAESCFKIKPKNPSLAWRAGLLRCRNGKLHSFYFEFEIHLHLDDLDLLRFICDTLGVDYVDFKEAFFNYFNRSGTLDEGLIRDILKLKQAQKPLLVEIRKYLISNLGFDRFSTWKLNNSSLIGIFEMKAKGGHLHKDKLKDLILKVLSGMNDFRLSTYKASSKLAALTSEELTILESFGSANSSLGSSATLPNLSLKKSLLEDNSSLDLVAGEKNNSVVYHIIRPDMKELIVGSLKETSDIIVGRDSKVYQGIGINFCKELGRQDLIRLAYFGEIKPEKPPAASCQ
ncbi:putative GIY-YIG homing endonuclease, partial [Tanacetum coccineum]